MSIANIGDGIAVSCRYWGGDYSERYGGSEEGVSGYVTSYLQHFEATVVSLPHDGQERRYTAQPTWPQAAVPGLADLNASYE
jgi:hypothetical protein